MISESCRARRSVVFKRLQKTTVTFLLFIVVSHAVPVAAEQGCGAAWGVKTADFQGEVYGTTEFEADAGPNTFALNPTPFGWRIAMRDAAGNELPVFTPPLRPVGNLGLDIVGWHFRNRDNSGPNRGDVNAPQMIRKFTFGRYATDPTLNPELIVPSVMPSEGDRGHGEVIIEDYGLADLEPGQRARMVYMKFTGCVEWNPGHHETTLAQSSAPGIGGPVVAVIETCGLDAQIYRLSDRMAGGREGGQRPWLEPDLDGDGLNDLVIPITRTSDDAPGLALCLRKTNSLLIAGYAGSIGEHLDPEYFRKADWWNVHAREGQGDAIILGIEGASNVLLYIDSESRLTSGWQGD